MVKMVKGKRKNLENKKKTKLITLKGISIRLTSDFPAETIEA